MANQARALLATDASRLAFLGVRIPYGCGNRYLCVEWRSGLGPA